MTPLERADLMRLHVTLVDQGIDRDRMDDLLPPGSLILTPDEAEKVRDALQDAASFRSAASQALALLAGKGQT